MNEKSNSLGYNTKNLFSCSLVRGLAALWLNMAGLNWAALL